MTDGDDNEEVVLSWTNPDDLKVRIVRQTLVAAGSLKNYPDSASKGTVVYEGSKTEFTDKGLEDGVQQFYTAFAFHPQNGWSSISWDAVDTALPGAVNPNIALEKKVTSSIEFNSNG